MNISNLNIRLHTLLNAMALAAAILIAGCTDEPDFGDQGPIPQYPADQAEQRGTFLLS